MAPLPADLSKVNPADAWQPWLPTADEPWDRKRAAHLFRRAAFGATPADEPGHRRRASPLSRRAACGPPPAELDAAVEQGFAKTLERLIAGSPDAAEQEELLTETGRYYNEPANLRVWWLYAMIEGGHP